VPDTELAALQELYDTTNGDSWNWHGEGNKWNFTDPNPCVDAWQGVNCSQVAVDGFLHVTGLCLNEYSLVGTIPLSMAQLTQLGTLRLSSNELSGTIPESVGQLTVLRELSIDANQLTGGIPISMGQLTHLQVLDLEHNLLAGTIPDVWQQLTQLTQLSLDYNMLTGSIPASVGQLTALKLLALNDNLLSGAIPDSLQQLTQLKQLFLYDNQLTGSMPVALGQLTQLAELDLDTNLLTGTIPASFKQLTQLTRFYLDHNLLTGVIPSTLGELTQLAIVDLDSNLLSGTIPDSFQQLTQLKQLYLDGNVLTGPIPAGLSELTQLVLIALQYNQLSGAIPESLSQLTVLSVLYLNRNRLTGTIPASLGQLTQLRLLDLDTNLLSGPIPDTFQQLTQLSVLYLQDNQLTGAIPDSLVTLTQLRLLQLGANRLTGPIPDSVSQLSMLEIIDMQNNHFTGVIPPSLGQLSQLRVLVLSNNHLQGNIPQNWTAAAHTLRVLHFHENSLSGPIPEALGYMPLLLSLNLSSNGLTGTVPASFQQLGSLQVLMLHKNQLRGTITELFSPSQANLSTVQLSGNQLTGTLPAAAFLLPSLSSFAAVDNCFVGPLPEEAICGSGSLSSLVLDGLHSAPACRYGASLYRQGFKLGTLPQCLLSMPNLATLHLSGSGLTGRVSALANVSAVLTDLSLSHNLLTGDIPGSILGRDWDKLDLSYNRLAGTTHYARVAPYGNTTELHLQHNRLSGVVPGSMQRVGTLSLLENNMFSCRVDRSDVPQQAADSDKYTCGSDAVNNSLYAWLGALVAVIAASVMMITGTQGAQQTISTWFAALRDTKLAKLQDLLRAAGTLRVLGEGSAAYCVVVLLPVYAVVNLYDPSFTYKYAWTVSGVFLTGTAAFAVEAVFLLLQLPMCAYAAERLLSRNDPSRQLNIAGATRATAESYISGMRGANVAVMLLSLAVVTGINIAFVIATLNLNGRELTVVQILLAVLKLGFNNIVAPALQNRVRTLEARREMTASQLLLVVVNIIVIPCVVVMLISPACFYDALTGTDPVTSNYRYGGSCLVFRITVYENTREVTVTCADVLTELGSTSYTPPFTYSYQCSSSFVTYYAPTFVIMCIISGFVRPAYHVVLLWLRRHLSPASRLYTMVTAATPRILRDLPSPQGLFQACRDPLYRPVFDANKLMMSLLTYLALLLTFGALFPPLAVCCAVAMASEALTARLGVGRYMSAAVAADRQDCLNEVKSACAGVATPHQLRMALYLVLAVSCLFYTLFLFDTLGYEVGFAGAFWVLIVVPLLPVVAWALYTAAIRVRGGVPAPEDNKTKRAVDPEVGMELASMQRFSAKLLCKIRFCFDQLTETTTITHQTLYTLVLGDIHGRYRTPHCAQQLRNANRVVRVNPAVAATKPERQIVEVTVHAGAIHKQFDQHCAVTHEDVMHQPGAVGADHNIGVQIGFNLLLECEHVVVDVLHHDLLRVADFLALQAFQCGYDRSVVGYHPAQAALAKSLPQFTQKERILAVAVFFLGPFLARSARHVGHDDGIRRRILRVVG
jgi:Leucine-rich repeat (LRR) protein